MSNTARDILIPSDTSIFRIAFLYVGQGEATLLVLPDNGTHRFMLVDTNVDKERGGINMAALLKDLLDDDLDVFVNTHPHSDHVRGLRGIHDSVGIKEVWHSGHVPSKEHKDAYDELLDVIKDIGADNTFEMRGTREENTLDQDEQPCLHPIGEPNYNVLAPAQYVKDDIEGEEPEERYRRIHEHCGVIRFVYGNDAKAVLLTGDSNRTAWEEHITDYHEKKLPSYVLSASHHGSRTFFKKDEDDEAPYKKHMDKIEPSYVVVSAPKQSESKHHHHPHDDAIEIYEEYVDSDALLHLGEKRECVIMDIGADGGVTVTTDTDLVDEYGYDDDENGDDRSAVATGPFVHKSSTGDKTPRRYG